MISFTQSEADSTNIKPLSEVPSTRHIVSLNGTLAYPLYYEMRNKSNSGVGNFHLNSSFRLSYTYSRSKRFGFGLEYGIDFCKGNLYNGGIYSTSSLITNDDLNIKFEGFTLMGHNLMPFIEWKRNNSNRPNGFVHQFGIGVTYTQVLKMNYDYDLTYWQFTSSNSYILVSEDPNDAEDNFDIDQLYNYKNKGFWGGVLSYSLSYRGKLTESLLWSLGIRTQFNLTIATFKYPDFTFDAEDTEYWINSREMERIVAEGRRKSILQFQFGLTYKLDK